MPSWIETVAYASANYDTTGLLLYIDCLLVGVEGISDNILPTRSHRALKLLQLDISWRLFCCIIRGVFTHALTLAFIRHMASPRQHSRKH